MCGWLDVHSLIVGTTESGKTTLAKRLCAHYHKNGWGCLVLDPNFYPGAWQATKVLKDPAKFLQLVHNSRKCMIFVDEASESCGQHDKEMIWLARQARHWGHSCHFITTRGAEINTTIRSNCNNLNLFACTANDAKVLANNFNNIAFKQASTLGQGEYLSGSRFGEVKRYQLFKPRR